MKDLNRREFLATSGALAGSAVLPAGEAAAAGAAPPSYDEATAVLYDATRCIGCRSCQRACREYNRLSFEAGAIDGVRFDMPEQLSEDSWMVLQAYAEDPDAAAAEGREPEWSYLKRNCMHCNVPACVSVCPVGALQKTGTGAVAYDEDRCMGCRYCLFACPYRVPRYEWVDRMPRVRKCNWNRSCVKACPVGALHEGRRFELIAEAHRRIDESPDRYVDHVYGEDEGGGTSYLILAGVSHDKLGLPSISPLVRSAYVDPIMGSLPGWIIGMGLFLGGWYQMEKRRREREAERNDEASREARP
jgi:Fe-S-cluster-containing dehydrogenase component